MSTQPLDALNVANHVRTVNGQKRRELSRMNRYDALCAAADVLDANEHPNSAMRIDHLLVACPAMGPIKAERILRRAGIMVPRRIRDLTDRQRRELANHLRDYGMVL